MILLAWPHEHKFNLLKSLSAALSLHQCVRTSTLVHQMTTSHLRTQLKVLWFKKGSLTVLFHIYLASLVGFMQMRVEINLVVQVGIFILILVS